SVTTLVLVKAQLGDFNLDGVVNNADLQSMLTVLKNESSYETAHNLTAANLLSLGDFNHDGVVDTGDLTDMVQYLTTGTYSGAGQTAAVPEPASLALLGLGGVLLASMTRRRANVANR